MRDGVGSLESDPCAGSPGVEALSVLFPRVAGKRISAADCPFRAAACSSMLRAYSATILAPVTLTTRDQRVLSVGPLTAATESARRTVPLPTVVGGAVVAAGIAVVFLGSFRRRRSQVDRGAKRVDLA